MDDEELLDLERGLPTSARDIEALRRLRPEPMSFDAYLDFLAQFPPPSAEALRARRGPRGAPFRLG